MQISPCKPFRRPVGEHDLGSRCDAMQGKLAEGTGLKDNLNRPGFAGGFVVSLQACVKGLLCFVLRYA